MFEFSMKPVKDMNASAPLDLNSTLVYVLMLTNAHWIQIFVETKKFVKTFKVVTSVFVPMVLLNLMTIIALISMNVRIVLIVMKMRCV